MKAIKIFGVAALCLSLAGCPLATIMQATLASVGLACAPQTQETMEGVKNGLVSVIAKTKAYVQELEAEIEQARDPVVLKTLENALGKAILFLNKANDLYGRMCKALTGEEWTSAWDEVQAEEIQVDTTYSLAMQKARLARLSK